LLVRTRYQYGSLRLRKRERGPDVWEFRYLRDGLEGPTETTECDPWRSQSVHDGNPGTEGHASEPYRTMVLVAQCLGLRISEILGLQWGDFNFQNRTVLVQRSVVGGRVDEVKTEYSKDHVPLDPRLAEVLLNWRSISVFPKDTDWLFANPVTGRPFHQDSLQKSQIKRAAKAAKLGEDIGWHTFRHSYRSWLDETGAPMKVQQELMRHASIQTTMNVYGRVMTETKRQANSQVVELVFGPNSQKSASSEAPATLQ